MVLGGAVIVMAVFWLAMNEAIFPSLFRFNTVRRIILGKYYIEGTWVQAERAASGSQRLAIIDIQPAGQSFIFSGYAVNRDLEVEANILIEFSKIEWPFMTYKYRNSLSDGSDGLREGVGEIHFEMNRTAANRFNGFTQPVMGSRRVKIEGVKLTRNSEVKRLRTLEGRKSVLQRYWTLYFNSKLETGSHSGQRADRPEPGSERRRQGDRVVFEGSVIPRRRTSDWRPAEQTMTANPQRPYAAEEETEMHEHAQDEQIAPKTSARQDAMTAPDGVYDEYLYGAEERSETSAAEGAPISR